VVIIEEHANHKRIEEHLPRLIILFAIFSSSTIQSRRMILQNSPDTAALPVLWRLSQF
jgi:hypothetical protein